MKKFGRKKISEKKIIIKEIYNKKRRKIKFNKSKKKYKSNRFYIIIFIGICIICFLIYLLKKQLKPK